MNAPCVVRGLLDGEGRLIEAEPQLAALQRSAGGEESGPLAIPQIATLARLARRLGVTISRSAVAAQDDYDLDLWVQAEPLENGVALSITGWNERPLSEPPPAVDAERDSDFLRASADWTWETDASLRFTALSPAAVAAAGKMPADLIGTLLTSLFRLEGDEEGNIPILTSLAEQSRFEDQIVELIGGRGGTYRLAGIPLIDGHGRFAGFRGSASAVAINRPAAPRPVSPPAETSAFGERLDKALRAPLAHIIANAETMGTRVDGPLRKDYAGYASDIASAGRHLLSLVDDLVDLQAIERPDFMPEQDEIDLADIARRAAGLLAVRASGRQVRIDGPGPADSLPATGEFKRALQIMMNLLTNAIRYSPEGGMVRIHAERHGDFATLIVADQGKGVSDEDQIRIFEKFERVDPTEPGGTGLGLYIARRLARAMGGDINVDSAPGKGARFTFRLPLISNN